MNTNPRVFLPRAAHWPGMALADLIAAFLAFFIRTLRRMAFLHRRLSQEDPGGCSHIPIARQGAYSNLATMNPPRVRMTGVRSQEDPVA